MGKTGKPRKATSRQCDGLVAEAWGCAAFRNRNPSPRRNGRNRANSIGKVERTDTATVCAPPVLVGDPQVSAVAVAHVVVRQYAPPRLR